MYSLTPLKIYVNEIIHEGIITHGIVVLKSTIYEDIDIIYKGKIKDFLISMIKNSKEAFYSFDRFCQYVIYLQFQPILGLSIKISDFKNDTDAALDEYMSLRIKDWLKKDTDIIMKIFQEIKNDKTNTARMVIKDTIA